MGLDKSREWASLSAHRRLKKIIKCSNNLRSAEDENDKKKPDGGSGLKQNTHKLYIQKINNRISSIF